MKILIVEDNKKKQELLESVIMKKYEVGTIQLIIVDTLSAATKQIYETKYDLIILDLMLPNRENDIAIDVSAEILGVMKDSDQNLCTNAIALTGYDDLRDTQVAEFAEAGIGVVLFDAESDSWQKALELALTRVGALHRYDFIFICALEKERRALEHTNASLGEPFNFSGLDCVPVTLESYRGVAVKPSRMGLVDAAICTTHAVEIFHPRIVAMPGICAGFEGEASLGDLIAPPLCWEYQTGKWTSNGFKMEAYSVESSTEVTNTIATLIASDPNGKIFKEDVFSDEIASGEFLASPMTSGSAVISNDEVMSHIGEQHRKVAGLDMEMYSVFRACSKSIQSPMFFGAKTVVDMGDTSKNNHLQTPGAVLSARFVVEVTNRVLSGDTLSKN